MNSEEKKGRKVTFFLYYSCNLIKFQSFLYFHLFKCKKKTIIFEQSEQKKAKKYQ
jgi:hypothetical protein